jgi:hypothetical protein
MCIVQNGHGGFSFGFWRRGTDVVPHKPFLPHHGRKVVSRYTVVNSGTHNTEDALKY